MMDISSTLSTREKIYANGKQVALPTEVSGVKGLININFLDDGQLFTYTKKNSATIYGNMFQAEKAMNKRINFDNQTLERILQVYTDAYILTDATLGQEKIIGLVAGTGGSEGQNVVTPSKRQSKVVPSMVPFRVVAKDADLEGAERKRYFLRVVGTDNFVRYYGKTYDSFDVSIRYEDGTEVPQNIHQTPGSAENIDIYNRFIFKVDTKDFREHFMALHGDTSQCQISAIGLVTGIPIDTGNGVMEYRNVRTITVANITRHNLSNPANTIDFEYYMMYR